MKKNLFVGFWRFTGIVLVNSLLLFSLSCQKEEPLGCQKEEPLGVKNDGIAFRDGRLIFKDDSSFRNHRKWLFKNESNPQLIAEKNKSLGLKSMTEYYLDGMKLDQYDPMFVKYVASYPNVFTKETIDSSTIYFLPHSKILCYVANKDGVYQIGEQVFRIVQNYVYRTDESKIDKLFLPKDQIPLEDVKISLSQPKLETKDNDYASQPLQFTNNNNFRILSVLREHTDMDPAGNVHWTNEIFTYSQHRIVGKWWNAQLNTVTANNYGFFLESCPGSVEGQIDINHSVWTGWSSITFFDGINNCDLLFDYSYCPAFSSGRLDGEYVYVEWADALNLPASRTWRSSMVRNDPY